MSAPGDASMPPFQPDRGSPIPLYYQVAAHLEAAIVDGRIAPGTRFENEIQLAQEMGLSRPTMRRAMQHLVDRGLVVRRRGVGTRVVQPKVRRPLELSSLHDDLAAAGQQPGTEVLSLQTVPAAGEVAEELQVEDGTPVVRIERLRTAGEYPIAQMTNYLPEDVVTFDLGDLERHGLYHLLRRAGVTLHSANQSIGARSARAAEARTLGESRGAALLTMTRTTFDDHGRPVEYATHLYAASRYSIDISLLTG